VSSFSTVIVREGGRFSTPGNLVSSRTPAITGYPAFAGYDD
jgi:hypothetical protein